jgi:hypothetical protein
MLCRVLKRHASHNSRFIYQYRQYSLQPAFYRPLHLVTQSLHSFTSKSPFAISKLPSSSPIFSDIDSIRFYGKPAVKRSVSLDVKPGPPTNQEPDTPMPHGHSRPRNLNLTMSHAVRYQADLEPPFCSLAVKDAFEQASDTRSRRMHCNLIPSSPSNSSHMKSNCMLITLESHRGLERVLFKDNGRLKLAISTTCL